MTDTDLRPALAQGQRWADTLIAATSPAQLDAPTPCAEFTVRELIAHMIGGTRRVAAMGSGQSALSVDAHPAAIPDDALATAFGVAMADAQDAWRDDASLTREVTVPWGTVTGAGALGGYLTEILTHGWDLAAATGQDPEADPALAALGLEQAMVKVPSGDRAGIPFAPAVDPADDAGPTERLANWMGRRSRPDWVR